MSLRLLETTENGLVFLRCYPLQHSEQHFTEEEMPWCALTAISFTSVLCFPGGSDRLAEDNVCQTDMDDV